MRLSLNKSNLATVEQVRSLENYAAELYPPKSAVIVTNQSEVVISLINLNHKNKQTNITKELAQIHSQEHKSSPHTSQPLQINETNHLLKPEHNIIHSKVDLPGLVTREIQNQLNTLSVGWIFDDSIEFN